MVFKRVPSEAGWLISAAKLLSISGTFRFPKDRQKAPVDKPYRLGRAINIRAVATNMRRRAEAEVDPLDKGPYLQRAARQGKRAR